jgi:hypothetical protein
VAAVEKLAIAHSVDYYHLRTLEQQHEQLLLSGWILPEGCWIETGQVKGKKFRQAWLRASQPIFPSRRSRGNGNGKVKSCYLGKEGGDKHREAIAAKERRDELKRLKKQITLLRKESKSD